VNSPRTARARDCTPLATSARHLGRIRCSSVTAILASLRGLFRADLADSGRSRMVRKRTGEAIRRTTDLRAARKARPANSKSRPGPWQTQGRRAAARTVPNSSQFREYARERRLCSAETVLAVGARAIRRAASVRGAISQRHAPIGKVSAVARRGDRELAATDSQHSPTHRRRCRRRLVGARPLERGRTLTPGRRCRRRHDEVATLTRCGTRCGGHAAARRWRRPDKGTTVWREVQPRMLRQMEKAEYRRLKR